MLATQILGGGVGVEVGRGDAVVATPPDPAGVAHTVVAVAARHEDKREDDRNDDHDEDEEERTPPPGTLTPPATGVAPRASAVRAVSAVMHVLGSLRASVQEGLSRRRRRHLRAARRARRGGRARFGRRGAGILWRLTMSDQGDTQQRHTPRRPRARLLEGSPRFADSFGLVLLLLILSVFTLALAGDGVLARIASLVVFAATTRFALRAAQVQRRLLRLALALIPLMVLVAIILVIFGDDETATVTAKLVIILLVVAAPAAILRRLVQHPVISANTFYGAVCVYLLIAMFFATTFGLIAAVSGEPFFAQSQSSSDPATQIDYLYFSFVTLTTVGYGDLTAAADLGRMLAIFEAILGQLYLITVVAIVVQNLGNAHLVERNVERHEAPAAAGRDGGTDPDQVDAISDEARAGREA